MAINKRGFAIFLANSNPRLYRLVASKRPDLLGISSQMGADTSTTAASGTDWASQIMDVLKTAVAGKAQLDLYKLQTQRAAVGLAPIDPASIAPTVSVAPSPELAAQVKQTAQLVTWAVVGLVGIIGYKILTKRPAARR